MSAADRLARIRARAEAATPGPWDAVTSEIRGQVGYSIKNAAGAVVLFGGFGPRGGPQELDAALAAHAREDLPALLAAVEAVLALHQPHYLTHDRTKGINQEFCCARAQLGGISWCECEGCGDCEIPCPTVRAITEALA